MKTLIVGQRGVGKTSFLSRLQAYNCGKVIDLDAYLGISFTENTENEYRAAEISGLNKISAEFSTEDNIFVAAGAGINLSEVDKSWKILWLRRKTDSLGRIFLNRPRLNSNLSDMNEYFYRAKMREQIFFKLADDVFWIDEGIEEPDEIEEIILTESKSILSGYVTYDKPSRFYNYAEQIELRNDLLTPNEIKMLACKFSNVLISFRKNENTADTLNFLQNLEAITDWALELGEPSFKPDIVSIHANSLYATPNDLISKFEKYERENIHCKLAIQIKNFKELKFFDSWQRENQKLRSFLPMSKDGRWQWYRLLSINQQKIGFWRVNQGSSPDQPTLMEWIRRREIQFGKCNFFAAVLGNPVDHSRSPIEHFNYFKCKQIPFFRIQVEEHEWSNAIEFLKEKGLKFAAVTSPLKQLAGKDVNLESANTLIFNRETTIGTSPDETALSKLANMYLQNYRNIAVWGGGGLLPLLKVKIPNAVFFKARTGVSDKNIKFENEKIALIFAARANVECLKPEFKADLILDLNYTENSPARVWAKEWGAKYISGLEFFKAQAKEQQAFWDENGK